MSDNDLRRQVNELSAKLTAVIMLVESLYADELARGPRPDLVAEGIIQNLFETDQKVRHAIAESEYLLQLSETISSLLDRAAARAKSLRSKRGQL